MDPQIWGKHGWIFLHSVTLAYPDDPTENDKQNYRTFFNTLPFILPCAACRQNLDKHMGKVSLDQALTNKKSLVKWLIAIHNETNITLGKPILSYDEVIAIYKQLYSQSKTNKIELFTNTLNANNSKNTDNNQTNIYYISFAIILGIIIIALFIWKKKSVLFA
jgi:hypothetical protein